MEDSEEIKGRKWQKRRRRSWKKEEKRRSGNGLRGKEHRGRELHSSLLLSLFSPPFLPFSLFLYSSSSPKPDRYRSAPHLHFEEEKSMKMWVGGPEKSFWERRKRRSLSIIKRVINEKCLSIRFFLGNLESISSRKKERNYFLLSQNRKKHNEKNGKFS